MTTYFEKELFIRFTASAFRKLPSIYVFSYFPFGFEGRMRDLIVSVPDHCLSFYVGYTALNVGKVDLGLGVKRLVFYEQKFKTLIHYFENAYFPLLYGVTPSITEIIKSVIYKIQWFESKL